MSETETLVGTLTEVEPRPGETLEIMMDRILAESGHHRGDYYDDIEEEFEDTLYHEYILVDGTIYKVAVEKRDPWESIFKAERQSGGSISFTVQYHNGGMSFNEAIEKALSRMKDEPSAELHYLRWFKMNTDFGPADGDVQMLMDEQYEQETGRRVPDGWRRDEE